ncbi:MAG: alkyl hydroperoxide reductase/thiol specific antioxidant/Mal allergen [uncultured bacterium]|nr:MAG: alkyl hydroperoxide reductase/thiol specific antioxidant/Mal allergen [uncultured bacterium]
MIIIFAIIIFALVIAVVIYLPFRKKINAWFKNKGYRNSKNVIAAVAIMAVVVMIVVVYVLTNDFSKRETANELKEEKKVYSLELGTEAPPFALENTDGVMVKSSDFSQGLLLLSFWNTWCKFCAEQLPDLKNFAQEMGDKAKVILINLREGREEVKLYKERESVPFDMLLDMDGSVGNLYRVRGTPSNFFVKGGLICGKKAGAITKADIIVSVDECNAVFP